MIIFKFSFFLKLKVDWIYAHILFTHHIFLDETPWQVDYVLLIVEIGYVEDLHCLGMKRPFNTKVLCFNILVYLIVIKVDSRRYASPHCLNSSSIYQVWLVLEYINFKAIGNNASETLIEKNRDKILSFLKHFLEPSHILVVVYSTLASFNLHLEYMAKLLVG